MVGNAVMTFGLILDIIGIFVLRRHIQVQKWTREGVEEELPSVNPEEEFIVLLSARASELGIWKLTINVQKAKIGVSFLIAGLIVQSVGIWIR